MRSDEWKAGYEQAQKDMSVQFRFMEETLAKVASERDKFAVELSDLRRKLGNERTLTTIMEEATRAR